VGGEFLDLILEASPIVKIVLLLLVVASVVSWAVIVQKARALAGAAQDSEEFLDVYQRQTLEAAFEAARGLERSSLAVIFLSGCEAMSRLSREAGHESAGQLGPADHRRVGKVIERATRSERVHAEKGLTLLATVGSSAPFVGLFGTVVGIINTFQGIGSAGHASLAVVGPGMAEALVATAVGLLAAIPASVAYNVFLARVEEANDAAESFAHELADDLARLARPGGSQSAEEAE
jgi:biopolymer transport protein TolQ